MTIPFAPLIERNQAVIYFVDEIMQAQTVEEMFDIIATCHDLLRKSGLKVQPEKKTIFVLRRVQFLGRIISKNGIQPVKKKADDLKGVKLPENKRDVLSVLGNLGFDSMYIKNLHVDSKPSYDLIRKDTIFKWTPDYEKLFKK